MGTTVESAGITEHELYQVDRANATTATPVVLVHGLWLLPSSWDRWAALFEEAIPRSRSSSGSRNARMQFRRGHHGRPS